MSPCSRCRPTWGRASASFKRDPLDFSFTVQAIAAAVTEKTRMIILTDSHNPSGSQISGRGPAVPQGAEPGAEHRDLHRRGLRPLLPRALALRRLPRVHRHLFAHQVLRPGLAALRLGLRPGRRRRESPQFQRLPDPGDPFRAPVPGPPAAGKPGPGRAGASASASASRPTGRSSAPTWTRPSSSPATFPGTACSFFPR